MILNVPIARMKRRRRIWNDWGVGNVPLGEETADAMRMLGPALMGNPSCDYCHQPIDPERQTYYKIERHYRPARLSRNINVDTNFYYHDECYKKVKAIYDKVGKGPAGEGGE